MIGLVWLGYMALVTLVCLRVDGRIAVWRMNIICQDMGLLLCFHACEYLAYD